MLPSKSSEAYYPDKMAPNPNKSDERRPSFSIKTNRPGSIYLKSPLDPFKHVIRLSDKDLHNVRSAVGALTEGEDPKLVILRSTLWPARGLPAGLYKDVVRARTISMYQYYICSLFFNSALIIQLLLGAALTGISSSLSQTAVITVLAAANTVTAGLLALMHNSGLPHRFKKDWNEFDYVEMYLSELIRSGVVKDGMSRDQVIEYCYGLFKKAKGTVARNKPATYATSNPPAAQGGDKSFGSN
jgi:hypothetical protein